MKVLLILNAVVALWIAWPLITMMLKEERHLKPSVARTIGFFLSWLWFPGVIWMIVEAFFYNLRDNIVLSLI